MSVASPARLTPRASTPDLVNPFPMRYPDSSSRQVMSRRGWWLVLLNFFIPGSAQAAAGGRRLARIGLFATLLMWALVVLTALTALLWRSVLFSLATNWFVLLLLQGVCLAYAALWILLTIDTLRIVRLVKTKPLSRFGIVALAAILAVASSGGAAYAANAAGATRGAIVDIFGSSAPAVPPSDGYYNILVLGADSGEGRDSMRFDSISVVSVNADSGAVTITGLPRDMGHFPFAEGPMQDLYPDGHSGYSDPVCGWGSGLNQLRTEVEVCRDGAALYPDAVSNGSEPGVEATKDAAEGILGIEIPYYVFIDMDGFAALIDALGGVDINVTERLPEGGGPAYEGQPADDWAIGWIEIGQQHMDGNTAQWYARSRYTTSDWDRMQRQRELQEAMLAQFTPENVLSRFQDIVAAGTHLVETDVPQSLLPTLAELAMDAKSQPVTTIELTPEANNIDQDDPDIDYIHELIRTTLHPPSPTPSSSD
ncbi:LCP family protein required for cell wall assembly [Microbacterium halimionae]|uniref:LCP family protein required for cell wall assembly n=1 Tax=Microbacterium halimionae TaxID=1526413 RepID=A0A7W3JPP6_9MICO|nr:LCP family protein [Microbacterium halimionae]MBA8816679.1 LCP family protein required for cell wall assembly [Microbacterium halimionae]NII95134.1 LCP family protein required for cell wall assembly [Microbacterium halimionae]